MDYLGVVSARIVNGVLEQVSAGGVFGGLAEHVQCLSCGAESPCPEPISEAVFELVSAAGYSDDGWVLPPND